MRELIKSDAFFSPCRKYRYWLLRIWDETLPLMANIGANPSTADENVDDPTIRPSDPSFTKARRKVRLHGQGKLSGRLIWGKK